MFGFTLAVLLATQCDIGQLPEKPLPVVIEHYDEIFITSPDTTHYSQFVWFVRDGRVIDSRLLLEEEMHFSVDGGKFSLAWRDYWRCDRYITCDTLRLMPTSRVEEGAWEWWAAARPMTALVEPPAEVDE